MAEHYFIGYDAREHMAALVCAFSIHRRSTGDPRIYFLEHQSLRQKGYFDRPWRVDEKGQFWDERDGRPFSTAFSHSRFLVFELAMDLNLKGPCMFVDCDFLFPTSPTKIMAAQAQEPDRIGVVDKTRKVDEGSLKMDGMVQQNYSRKLWSAMFTFMPHEKWAEQFSIRAVNNATGRDLHNFLNLPPSRFLSHDPKWHYIPSLDTPPEGEPGAIHYSEFSPWLNPERQKDWPLDFIRWHQEYEVMLKQFLPFVSRDFSLPFKTLEKAD